MAMRVDNTKLLEIVELISQQGFGGMAEAMLILRFIRQNKKAKTVISYIQRLYNPLSLSFTRPRNARCACGATGG